MAPGLKGLFEHRQKGKNHDRFFGKTFHLKSCGNRHGPINNKKAKARNPAAVMLTGKLLIMSGRIGPRISVNKEIAKNVRKTKPTM